MMPLSTRILLAAIVSVLPSLPVVAFADSPAATAPQLENANRLLHEKSPDLLQPAPNPVDRYPWGAAASAWARTEKKPIFLSIGYSTCPWCHGMERESFENPAGAKLPTDKFVCSKVDRTERPDGDSVHLPFVQATTGRGGCQ